MTDVDLVFAVVAFSPTFSKVDISIVTDLGWRVGIRLALSLGTLENINQSDHSLA